MEIRVASLFASVVLIGAFLSYIPSASTNSSNPQIAVPRAVLGSSNLFLPLTTTFTVDRMDDTAAATACTGRNEVMVVCAEPGCDSICWVGLWIKGILRNNRVIPSFVTSLLHLILPKFVTLMGFGEGS